MAGITSRKVYEFLLEKGVEKLYHANSVATSCLFLREETLFSRGTVERNGFKQTSQTSDAVDKKYSIWFDVFIDSVDIHHRARRRNVYGPVTLVLDTEIIQNNITGNIWVTKLNPTKWAGKTTEQRWFQDIEDLQENFTVGTFDHMIVFRHCGGELPWTSSLLEIILDDPSITSRGVEFYSAAYGALAGAMSDYKKIIPIRRRRCRPGCTCQQVYQDNRSDTKKMFSPIVQG
jgi:hypothetical protein